jgi:energy-coupling factor transporter ATP-binding protein EcfA2
LLSLEVAGYRHAGASADTLRDLALELSDGTLTGLLGASGSGLSTLVLVLGGLAPRVVGGRLRGTLRIDGEDVTAWPMHRLVERVVTGLGRPAAQLSLVAETVFEEVAFGPAGLGLPHGDVVARTWRALETMAVADLAGRDPRHLSGGEEQLVVLAGLLAVGAQHLLLDAPLTQLDPVARERVLDALRMAADAGVTVLVAEHRASILADRCDVDLRIAHGRLGEEAPKADPRPTGTAVEAGTIPAEVPDVTLEGVTHAYASGVRALDGVDLHIDAGEAVAIVGPNGSGKTTLARHLDGLLRPTQGRVLVGGEDAARRSVASLTRSVAVGFQDPDRQIFARIVAAEVGFGPRQLGREGAAVERSIDHALAAVGLAEQIGAHPADLAEGQRKLLAIASLLAMESPVLVLDEPTAGLDDAGVAIVARVVAEERAQGRTVIAISHDRSFVTGSFPRAVRLERGRVVADGSPASVLEASPRRNRPIT